MSRKSSKTKNLLRLQVRAETEVPAGTGRETVAEGGEWPCGLNRLNFRWPDLAIGGSLLASVLVWAYWPTLVEIVSTWNREPDYSHGYFVAPLAIWFLWVRRDTFPGPAGKLAWAGLILLALGFAMRFFAAKYYLVPVDSWSILAWIAGVVWLFGGRRLFWWSLPSIAFLWFMIPLPFRVERWLSLPLQRVATKISCWGLQLLGQPAFPEGNVILLNDHKLFVEEACSGLRIFMGIVALAFAYLVLVRRPWLDKILLLASALPIALVANSTRIIVTGLLYSVSAHAAETFGHDVAGWVMIPFAAGLFALVLWYVGLLFREVELLDLGTVIRREHLEMQPTPPELDKPVSTSVRLER